MFADLKEYQDLTRIYNESVNISEEERELQKFIDEEDFTLEELEFCVENFEEICSLEFNEDYLVESNLNEEDLHEILGGIFRGIGKALGRKAVVTMGKGGAGKIAKTAAKVTKGKGAKVLSKGAELKKRMAAAYDKNILGKGGSNLLTKAGTKVKNVTTKIGKTNLGKKLTGAGKNIAKTVKKNPAKLLVPGAIVGSGVAGFIAGGAGKKGSKGVAAPTNKLSDAELDAKIKAGIAATGMGDKGTAITQKGREQAAYNRGERAARKKLNDPTLNLTKSELEAKAAKEKEKAAADAKSKQKPMSKIEFQNRKRFGDKAIDQKKAMNVDFKKMRKGEMSKADFIKAYPKSQTAKKYNQSDKAYRDYKKGLKKEDFEHLDAYDMVLEYLFATDQVSTIEEAHYVMLEMDQQTIGEIVKEVKISIEESIGKATGKLIGGLAGKVVDKMEGSGSKAAPQGSKRYGTAAGPRKDELAGRKAGPKGSIRKSGTATAPMK
jgi:hypothetical protein